MPKDRVVCDFDCLHCALSDCERSGRDIARQPTRKRTNNQALKKKYGEGITYAALRHVPEPDYTIGLKTTHMDKEDLESMLATQYGRKLEPVRAK